MTIPPLPEKPCYHCGLPVQDQAPIRDIQAGSGGAAATGQEEKLFCCTGCLGAWQMISSLGLEAYYRLRNGSSNALQPDDADMAGLTAFDDPDYQRGLVATVGEDLEINLILSGIHCAACIWLNEQVLRKLPGVVAVQVNFSTQRAKIRWNPGETALSVIIQTIRRIGYQAEPYDPSRSELIHQKRDRELLSRLGVAAFGAANVMFLSVALYAGYFQGIEADFKKYFHWLSFALATPVVIYSGWLFFRGAWRNLSLGHLNMDLPISLGIIATYGYSVVITLMDQGEVYFDSVTLFIFILLTGRYLEAAARRKAAGATETLLGLEPKTATVIRDEKPITVPAREVRVGDLLLIKPGERIPVDGAIIHGRTTVDESMLTGESLAIDKEVGDIVAGGSMNVDGALRIQALRVGAETTLARIIQRVETAQAQRPHIQGLADNVAAYFVKTVLLLTTATLVYWLWRDPAQALENSVALLIITCPCALGLATPAAMVVATGAAARNGILVKNGETLERLERVTQMILDKTGTLTRGRPQVKTMLSAPGVSTEYLLTRAAAVEQFSEHPMGQAIVRALHQHGWPLQNSTSRATNTPGMGMAATIDGKTVRVGRMEFAAQEMPDPPTAYPQSVDNPVTWAMCAEEGRLLGWIGVSDQPKPEAGEAVAMLKNLGLPLSLLSGDRQEVVTRIAGEMGIDNATGQLLPIDKENVVGRLQEQGETTAMLGDGINDAPALARSDVAMVVENATDITIATADVILLNRNLFNVAEIFALARRTMLVIRQNFIFSFVYNAMAIPLAISGHVSPIVAAVAMPLSSLVVVGNAMRLKRIPKKG